MSENLLLLPVLVPAAAALLCLASVRRLAALAGPLLLLGALATFGSTLALAGRSLSLTLPLGAFDMPLRLRVDAFASFILIAASGIAALLAMYAASFLKGRAIAGPFSAAFLATVALLQGAVLADHLVTLLFFWEGMLGTLFVMIALGGAASYKTAVKAFFINGVTDLCMMAGIGLVFHLSGTLVISELVSKPLGTDGLGGLAFVLLVIGAISKAGSMPFHSWIPDAAGDAPLPFMALMPGAMEKLIGIYFLTRISWHLFAIADSWASTTLMVVGAVTILLAVLMALVQKDFKRLLSFHAISQVGYMVLGIGTALPMGIVGGLYHMLNNALYKSTLFLTAGAVEQQGGTTDLKQLGGLRAKMPITVGCFIVAALSISGFPLTNGFYSKELVYEAALHKGWIFYAAAALGSLFTAASFLKLGHAAFFGPAKAPKAEVKEAGLGMLVPMVLLAAACLVVGLGNVLVIDGAIVPALGFETGHFAGIVPHNWLLVVGTLVVLGAAAANHAWGVRRTGSGLGAVDHIHYAPVAHTLYDAAERRLFDPYELALKLIAAVARVGWWIDRGIDFLYNRVVTAIASAAAAFLHEAHSGSHATYLVWCVVGAALVVLYFFGGFPQ